MSHIWTLFPGAEMSIIVEYLSFLHFLGQGLVYVSYMYTILYSAAALPSSSAGPIELCSGSAWWMEGARDVGVQ